MVAVIGGGYGDEGKGLMTDYWASKLDNPIVIRFNGGCQAGHSVELENGNRHVFSHFSSGTFAGAPTYLSRFFVVNPTLFRVEHEEFVRKFGIKPTVYVDEDCLTTTPVEMMINQGLEVLRDHKRHGSVGVGFGETFERAKRMHRLMKIWYVCNVDTKSLRFDIEDLIKDYMPTRIPVNDEILEVVNHPDFINDFIDDVAYFKENTIIKTWQTTLPIEGDVIFEGAQGLEIDQDYGVFPFVTRSNCGMRNVSTLIDELVLMDADELIVNYVTRAYKTRHGAGPLRHEYEDKFSYKDFTNVHNDWQGTLRWGDFNYGEYRSITDKDFALYANEHNEYYNVRRMDTVTCMDQINNAEYVVPLWRTHPNATMLSYGPTRNTIELLE